MSKRVKVVHVVRLVGFVHPNAYYDPENNRSMTEKEMLAYERNMPKDEKIQQVIENIEISDEVEIFVNVELVDVEIDGDDYEEDDDD